MTHYRFERTWRVAAEPEALFDALLDTPSWPEWWPALVSVETIRGDPGDPLDRWQRFVSRAPLGYELELYARLLTVTPPEQLVARLEGDLEGAGRMSLSPTGDGTIVAYLLSVDIAKPWMIRLDPLLRPVFAWSHDRVVEQGIAGLARRVGAT